VNATGFPCVRNVLLKGVDRRGFVFFTNYDGGKGKQLAVNPRAALVFYWKILERQIRIEGSVERVPPEESDAYFHERPIPSQLSACVSNQSAVISSRAVLEQDYIARVSKAATTVVERCQDEEHRVKAQQALAAVGDALKHVTESDRKNVNNRSAAAAATLASVQDAYTQLTVSPSSNQHTAHTLYESALSILKRIDADPELSPLLHGAVRRPDNWGGFVIRPNRMEFWEDGKYRLHSRIQYSNNSNNNSNNNNNSSQQQHQSSSSSQFTSDVKWIKEFLAP